MPAVTAGAVGAEADENVVAAVLAVSIGAGATEYVVGVSAGGPDVLSLWKVFSPRWVAASTADLTSPMVSANDLVCARLEVFVFDAFRPAESPLTKSWVSSSSCAGGTSVPGVSSSRDAGVSPAPRSRMDPAAERNTDLRDFRSEADESASSPSAEAAPLSAEVVLVDGDFFVVGDFFVDEDVAVDEESPVADGSDGPAYAIPGVFAMAAPTPSVTASAPTRPMCLA